MGRRNQRLKPNIGYIVMESPVVQTSLGHVKGVAIPKAKHEEAKQVYAYMGIPFAKPPVGKLRFKAPIKAKPWKGVRDASKSPPVPMQSKALNELMLPYLPAPVLANEEVNNQSEDCLYLNVYTNNPHMAANLPVLFWIYGGAFTIGSAIGYNGQALCGLNDVVLVVPQYRVNVFGFYSLGKESSCKGNMGLQDQIMAMKWVRDNIRNFGGDPGNVTIFGESAGAVSVSIHVLSSESRGLFHRAISHSGVSTFPTMINADLSSPRKVLHEQLKITATDPDKILKKLTKLDAKTIIEAIEANEYYKTMFVATVDDKVLPKHPFELLQEGNFAPVPYMVGMNSTEGCGIMAEEMPPTFFSGMDKKTFIETFKASLEEEIPLEKIDEVADLTIRTLEKEFDDGDPYKWSKIMGSISGDSMFIAPSVGQAMAHSGAGHPTYVYYMTQQLKMHHDEEYSGNVKLKPAFCEADHGDDIMFTVGYPFLNSKFTREGFKFSDDERLLSRQWMKTLCAFAKSGNPNSDCSDVVQWPQYDSQKKRHLIMKMPYEEGSDLLPNRCKLWLETVPSILEK